MVRRSWPWRSLVLPGSAQLGAGEPARGIVYLGLAVATLVLAWCANRYGFLALVWRMRGIELPPTIVDEMYAAKQATAWNFAGLYLVIGLVAALDYVLTPVSVRGAPSGLREDA